MGFDYHEYRTVKISAYSIDMSKDLLDAFKIFADMFIRHGRNPLKMRRLKHSFNDNQYRNFSKLQYFGIIELEDKVHWILTRKGEMFYQGQIPIDSPAGWIGKTIMGDHHPAWKTYRGRRRQILINEFAEKKFKSREEYEEEKRGDTLFSHAS